MFPDSNDNPQIGLVGSPSTTAKVTVDIVEDATGVPLHGQLVSLTHDMNDRALIALGTVTEIKTSNRWHEDPNMRGVLKRHGSLPHLSGVGDVRTADVLVQAAYSAETPDPEVGEPPKESSGSLTMSPTTGAPISGVTDGFLRSLLRKHENKMVYIGKIFKMDTVRSPLIIRDFGPVKSGGAGEAYHTGVFGMTGSGKSVFASYLLAVQLLNQHLGVIVMDPQGQFSSEEGLTFSLQEWAEDHGWTVQVLSISNDLKLNQDANLFTDLLSSTRFFRDLLTLRGTENRESAQAEFSRILKTQTKWHERTAEEVLREVLEAFVSDEQCLTRIYASPASRARFLGRLEAMIGNAHEMAEALDLFKPLHSLFTNTNLAGGSRMSLHRLLADLFNPEKAQYVVLDFSSQTSDLLDSTAVKARMLRVVCSMLNRRAETLYQVGTSLNTLVVFDEAQRFASSNPEDDSARLLGTKLVDYVRTTRKYGLGWMFITQEVGSLMKGIYSQLRVRCFGYGLTSGSELARLRETIGDRSALDLYRSFVDPQAVTPAQYSFMLTGPISPLSFTGAPVFVNMYTDFEEFQRDNGF